MKLSNNALNFLLAQYRAIFKRAYFKGLAAAVLVTASIAAGQAQADNNFYFTGKDGDWTARSTLNPRVDAVYAQVLGGNRYTNEGGISDAVTTTGDTLSGGIFHIGGDSGAANYLGNTVKRGTVVGGYANAASGDMTATNNHVYIAGSGTVDAGTGGSSRGLVYGSYSISQTGVGQALHSSVIVERDPASSGSAAASDGYIGGRAEGNTGALAGNNTVSIKGHEDALQVVNASDNEYDVVGGLAREEGTAQAGEYQANNNTVELQYISVTDAGAKNKGFNIAGGLTSIKGAVAINAIAQGNEVTISNSEIATTDSGNQAIKIVGGIGYQNLTNGSLNLSGNTVSLNDTTVTKTDGYSGNFVIAGGATSAQADQDSANKSKSVTATDNTVELTATSDMTVGATVVAGAAIVNAATDASSVSLTLTGNSVKVGKNVTVATDGGLAAVYLEASGSALEQLDASDNTVTLAGSVSGDVTAVKFVNNGNGALPSNIDFSKNKVILESGSTVTSGSLGGGTGANSLVDIQSGATFTVAASQEDIASDVIKIGGTVTVADGATLNIAGFYQNGTNATNGYNDAAISVADSAVITTSGTINVFGKMEVASGADLIATKDEAKLVINGTKGADAPELNVPNAGQGHLAIYEDTLNTYLKGTTANTDSKSGSVVLSGATLELLDNSVKLSDFSFSGSPTAGHITVDNSSNASTIKGQDIEITQKLGNSDRDAFLSGDTSKLNIVAEGTLSLGTNKLDSSSSPVDFGFAMATAKDLEVAASGGTLVLANNIILEAVTLEEETDSNNVYVQDNGTITGNLTLSGGDLTITHGSYADNSALNVASGDLIVGQVDSAAEGVKTNANGELVAASLNLTGGLTVGANGNVTVAQNGTLNTNTIDASAAGSSLTVSGDMTIAGAIRVIEGEGEDPDTITYGIKLAVDSVSVGEGATLTLGQAATSAIQVSTTANPDAADGANKYVTIDQDAFAGKVFTVAAGGTVFFSFGSEEQNQVFTTEAISELRSSLFNGINDGVIDGFINLGHAEIKGLDIKGDSVAWDKLAPYADIIADITTIDLANAKVTGIESADQVRGNFGSLDGTGIVTVVGNLNLNNADGNNNLFVSDANGNVGSLNVDESATVVLNNGGAIKDITFSDNGGSLIVKSIDSDGTTNGTTIEDIDAEQASATFGSASGSFGQTVVTGKTEVAQLNTEAGSETTFQGEVTVGAAAGTSGTSTLAGTTNFKADATFANDAELSGSVNFEQDANFSGEVVILGNTTVKAPTNAAANTSVATFGQDVTVAGAGTFSADSVVMTAAAPGTTPSVFSVGVDTTGAAQGTPSGTGYIEVGNFTLAGNDLVIDPAYGDKTSIAAIRGFGDDRNNKVDAGTVSGRIFVGMNAALDVGTDASIDHMADFIAQYQNAAGSLERANVGAVMYLSDELTVANGSRVILDSQRSSSDILAQAALGANGYGDGSREADLYLGQNTILAVGDGILEDGAAIHFESTDAGIMAQNQSAKIVLDGDKFLNSRNIVLFTDDGGAGNEGVRILGDHDIRVESLNGLMYFELTAGDTNAKGGTLKLDNTKINTAFSDATGVGRDMLLAYAARTVNYGEYYSQANQDKIAAGDPTAVDREVLVAGVAAASEAVLESDGTTITVNDPSLSVDDFTIIPVDNGAGATTPVLYRLAHNDLLESMGRNSTGRDFDSVAELGVFAGSAQAALLVAQTSQDAVAGRTGIGATASALTFADNGQGAGLWINPIYISQDSDGFGVDNKDYGVDIDLYGVALGGDYTLANGIRLGAFFNLGSGDSEGNGQASQVSSDFDYWGLGLYAGYSMGAFSVVGDFSYSVVDTDADAGTQVGTITSSYDTDIISVGVTGQYEFEVAGAQITPHAGLRYSTISIDDFDLTASGYQDGGHFDSDRMNVFSIPVGVTVAKEFAFETWTVKPSFDLSLQGNFGDDEIDSNNSWDGVANKTTQYSAEYLDSFTYGATVGVAAKTGNFSLGLGLGYIGSSNTDSFNATANARFTF